jgi:alpha-tubulin suppressor-like RCC1 family protein
MRRRGPVPSLLHAACVTLMGCGNSPGVSEPQVPEIEAPPAGFVRLVTIAADGQSACGLTADGATFCWGSGAGSGNRPRPLPAAPAFAALDVHDFWGTFMCGLTADGVAHCHRDGGLTTVPAPAPLVAVSAGTASCGRTAGGEAYCWTYSSFFGILGDGSQAGDVYIIGTPRPVAGGHRFDVLASSHLTTCGITQQRRAWCWGYNSALQIGDADASEHLRLEPSAVAGGHEFRSISLSPSHACALTTNDTAYCWGLAYYGQIGNPAASTTECPATGIAGGGPAPCVATPVPVVGGHRFTTMAAGWYHTCGVDRDGVAFCWGANAWGQLGNGRRGAGMVEREPVRVAGNLRFRALAAGEFFTCGIAMDDATYCWGSNQAGQLGAGVGPGEVRTVPHPIAVPH